jgi:hypothetical protein
LGFILIATLAYLVLPARAQSAATRPEAKPAEAKAQKVSAAEAQSRAELTPPVQKSMDEWLNEPRRIAAAVVASANPAPKYIVQIGAHHGEFLSVFLDKFPSARGLWTEPDNSEGNLPVAKTLLTRFGDRVDYKFGCGERDISDGCVPKGPDVIITDWVSILQNLDGMYKIYRIAAEQLAPGGWFVNIDQVGFGQGAWEPWLNSARKQFRTGQDAPPVHHPDFRTPTIDEQLGAMRAAGLDAHVVWQSFNTVVFMGRKQ